MDDFAEGDFIVADYALLEHCPYVDNYVFAPEFVTDDYVRVTQLYCDGVQGELMKIKGNEEFAKERYDIAIIYYTRAIEYRNALGDGKRATILKNTWPKGHYRYCDALSMLGEYDWALQANLKAQKLCKNDPEGIKDLIQQHVKLQKQIEDLQGRTPTKNPIKAFYESKAYTPRSLSAPTFSTSLNFVETERDFRKTNHEMANGRNQNLKVEDKAFKVDDCDCHPEFPSPSSQPPKHKGKQKSRNNESEKFSSSSHLTLPVELKNILEKQFSKSSRAAHQDFANIMKMLRSLIQDGYTALLEQRCRSAAQTFTELLNGLDPQKIKVKLPFRNLFISVNAPQPNADCGKQQLNLAMINYVLVVYGLAISLLGIGQPEELSEAENQFKRIIEHYPNEGLDCLAYCGIGKVYLKKNRFLEALNHFEKAKTLIYRLPGVLTWPTTNVIIEESQPGKIKDFLQGICLTPDCEGIISKIIIFSSGGQVKCEFEHKVIKEKAPPRPILKQKCSSLEKLRLKEDKKLKRKIQKKEAKKLAQERMEEDLRESNPPKNEEPKETVDNVQNCQFLDDRILQCIKQYADKIKSGILNTSKLLKELLSWKVLSTEDYTTCFSSRNFLNEAVDYVIRHLIREKDRVKTRIFLHVLSELKEVEPKLATWIQKLNSFGLDATGPFFSRYGASLKELDFSIMTFLWNEKYGHKLGSIEGKQLDYFYKPTSLKEARGLIWLLEEHRDKFPALHSALDEFFDIMDSRCTVLRKQDSGEAPFNLTKVKNKGKKKKPKDSKPMLVGSGTTSVTPNNETVTSSEDHNRRNSESSGPFAVPDHLRQDVEEFEALYDQHSNEYVVRNKKLWDINPKQKCSTLYDYFSQLLEEHGPLDMSNKIFSEEYEFFPEETRQILEKAGGLKSFLLGCPRFVVIDNCIALKKVALRLKKKRKKKNIKTKVEEISKAGEYLRFKLPLNPTVREFRPDDKSKPVSDLSPAPASEAVKPKPTSANCPTPACDDVKSKLASDTTSRQVFEDGKPKGLACNSPQVSEGADHKQVSSDSPTPVLQDLKPTYWTQSHLVTGYCTYLPLQRFDIPQTQPTYINVLPGLPQYTRIYTALANVSSQYQLQGSIPVVPSFAANDRADKNAAAYPEGLPLNSEGATGNRIASETHTHEDSLGPSAKLQCSTGDTVAALSEPKRKDEHCGNSNTKCKENPESTIAVTKIPHTQMVATQVSWNVTHQETNTEPYDPFEAQQGDISQIEKEYQVLQEQLTEACEQYEQIKLKGSEETKDLEEKLKRTIEENKKTLYTEKNNGNDTEHELHLDHVCNNTFANEKMKLDECIKKGKEQCEESHQRAVAAEVSVLENWKESKVFKLQIMESQAEAYLKSLKLVSSDSAAHPNMESDIHSWESFLSNVTKEIEKAKSQFEEQIKAIKNGSQLSKLPEVQISELSFPAYARVCPEVNSKSSHTDDRGTGTSTGNETGHQTAAHKSSSLLSAGYRPVEAAAAPLPVSPSHEREVTRLPAPRRAAQAALSKHSPEMDQKLPAPPGHAARSSQSPKKSFNSIIEHLSAVFPCHSSTELAGFIKKVRNKNKNSLSGLSIDEIVQRVTEYILDEQKKEKPSPGKDKSTAAPSSAAPATRPASQGPPLSIVRPSSNTNGQRTEDVPVSSSNSCEICHEEFKSKNMRVLKCGHRFHKGALFQVLGASQELKRLTVLAQVNLPGEETVVISR
ncbi:E3 ubiquitin-protein ligase TTC3 [Tupaia chinensis]|uniref:RING-type E3 ubiquitin transferase n=1 Tax=Tupaia chinensis TaxID=246437 RepID=L9KYV3_TUPCH|nr:E3 ubiquitin-protein ligase TTC3 [Tupaia chinensis]